MRTMSKYEWLRIVQTHYPGQGWEDVHAEPDENRKEAVQVLRDYQKNELGARHRLIRRRVLREAQ